MYDTRIELSEVADVGEWSATNARRALYAHEALMKDPPIARLRRD